jgi:uncharacterized OB-fold protein
MSEPLPKPRRKNPLARTRLPVVPPSSRSRTAHGLTLAAAEGRFAIQRCAECGNFAYPPRDACPRCLSDKLPFVEAPSGGVLAALTTVQVSGDSYFRERMPWRTGIVTMDCGPRVIAHIHGDCVEGERVLLSLQLDRSGQAVMFATPVSRTPHMQDDPQWREMASTTLMQNAVVHGDREPQGQHLRLNRPTTAASLQNVLRGDLAAILRFAANKKNPGVLSETEVLTDLLSQKTLVAGVGFEPTTFRL